VQANVDIPVAPEQQQLLALLNHLSAKEHLAFMQLYRQTTSRLQCWLSRPLNGLFLPGKAQDYPSLFRTALNEFLHTRPGRHSLENVAEALLFVGPKAEGSWLPLFSNSSQQVRMATQRCILGRQARTHGTCAWLDAA
jgi:hypothetical protein